MAGLAMLGAGIFATDHYLPDLVDIPEFVLKAVYSRSQKSCDAFSAKATELLPSSILPGPLDTYFDNPAPNATGKSLDDLLARPDIAAVIVCMPIPAQPAVIKKALAAGKHVLSEKPVAKDVDTAVDLIRYYASLEGGKGKPVWGVAENFRFVKSLKLAGDKIREMQGAGGQLATYRLKASMYMNPGNKFFDTDWRKVPEYQGGYLLDGGIHAIAAIRSLLSAAGQSVDKVACFSSLVQPILAPVDSCLATARTDKGVPGTLTLTWSNEFDASGWGLEVVMTNGKVKWDDKRIEVTTRGGDGQPATEVIEMEGDASVGQEVKALAESMQSGVADPRMCPKEALKDLELLQAVFESGDAEGVLKTVTRIEV